MAHAQMTTVNPLTNFKTYVHAHFILTKDNASNTTHSKKDTIMLNELHLFDYLNS